MRIKNLRITLLFCLAGAPVFPATVHAAEINSGISGLSGEIAGYARVHKITRIAVLGFSSVGGVDANEAYSIAKKIEGYLAARGTDSAAERAALEKVMAEAKLFSAGADTETLAGKLRDIFRVDAIVTGAVFAVGGNTKITARLSDARTGRTLLTAKAEIGERKGLAAALPGFPGPYPWWDAADAPPPGDLRDAVSGNAESSCSGRRTRLSELNAELVDAKARYWADKMNKPGFGSNSLGRNPGIELTDPGVKAGFYRLLAVYYSAGVSTLTDPVRLAAVLNLIAAETRFFFECGIRYPGSPYPASCPHAHIAPATL